MKNIKPDPEDTLRQDYSRSDFGEVVRGKYATTQVGFHQLTEALLTCIAEDESLTFEYHSAGNYFAKHAFGDLTYEIDNANQITLRYWLSEFGSLEEPLINPSVIMNPKDRMELQNALLKGVTSLKAKAATLRD